MLLSVLAVGGCFAGCESEDEELRSSRRTDDETTTEIATTREEPATFVITTEKQEEIVTEMQTELPVEYTTEPETIYEKEEPEVVQMYELPHINDYNWKTIDKGDTAFDVDQNAYPGGNTFCANSWAAWGDNHPSTSSVEYNLGKQFKRFKATISPQADFEKDKSATFELYGDEKLIDKFVIEQKTEAFEVYANVTNVKYLKFVMYSNDGGEFEYNNIIIYNPLLYRE